MSKKTIQYPPVPVPVPVPPNSSSDVIAWIYSIKVACDVKLAPQ